MNTVEIAVKRGSKEIEQIYDIVYKNGGYIAGGFAAWCVSHKNFTEEQEPRDIDIFCKNPTHFETICKALESNNFTKLFDSSFSATYHHSIINFTGINRKIQVIRPITYHNRVLYGTMEHIIADFDISVAKVGILTPYKAMAHTDFIRDDYTGNANIRNEVKYPLAAISRMLKYIKKGYEFSAHNWISVLEAWDKTDNDNKLKMLNIAYNSRYEPAKVGEEERSEFAQLSGIYLSYADSFELEVLTSELV